MRNSDICIGTTGLHESIGWKTAEYVALGKAIVCEPLMYEIPGDFNIGKKYFTFTTVDECLDAVEKLMNNLNLVYEMKLNNLIYYEKFLKPDMLVKRTLDIMDNFLSDFKQNRKEDIK